MMQDLTVVKNELTKRFPPAYDIFNFYLEMYHDRARTIIDEFAESVDGTDTGFALRVVCAPGNAYEENEDFQPADACLLYIR